MNPKTREFEPVGTDEAYEERLRLREKLTAGDDATTDIVPCTNCDGQGTIAVDGRGWCTCRECNGVGSFPANVENTGLDPEYRARLLTLPKADQARILGVDMAAGPDRSSEQLVRLEGEHAGEPVPPEWVTLFTLGDKVVIRDWVFQIAGCEGPFLHLRSMCGIEDLGELEATGAVKAAAKAVRKKGPAARSMRRKRKGPKRGKRNDRGRRTAPRRQTR